MKISLNKLKAGLGNVARRFSFQIVTVALATYCGWQLVSHSFDERNVYARLLVVSNLIFVFSLAVDLFLERKQASKTIKISATILYVLLGIFLYYALDYERYGVNIFRAACLAVAFHLMVSFAPFLSKGNYQGFWQFNKNLFLRILTSGVYSGVLYAGLALAIASIEKLWGLSFDRNVYQYLFIFLGIFFNSVFFLAGIPKDFAALEQDNSYPKGLKIFTQYVLIPLMTVYLVILTIYGITILFQRSVPNGIISWLIMGYAIFGILTWLLVYPLRENADNKWIRTFSKIFYIMLFPLLALLFIAIGIRINNYGVTEERYTIVAIGIWLALISVYSLWKSKSIKVIPISLCILALIAVYGPISAPYISRNSQIKQLSQFVNGKRKDSAGRAYNIVSHIIHQYGIIALQPLTNKPLKPIEQTIRRKDEATYTYRNNMEDSARKILNIQAVDITGEDAMDDVRSFRVIRQHGMVYTSKNYDYILDVHLAESDSFLIDNKKFSFVQEGLNRFLLQDSEQNSVQFAIDSLVEPLRKNRKEGHLQMVDRFTYTASDSLLKISQTLDGYTFTMQIPEINDISKEGNSGHPYFSIERTLIFVRKNH